KPESGHSCCGVFVHHRTSTAPSLKPSTPAGVYADHTPFVTLCDGSGPCDRGRGGAGSRGPTCGTMPVVLANARAQRLGADRVCPRSSRSVRVGHGSRDGLSPIWVEQ